jgi:hypothetical protein
MTDKEQVPVVQAADYEAARDWVLHNWPDWQIGATRAKADLAELLARHRQNHAAPSNGLREALEPVLHWYQSDEQDERPLEDIVRDVVTDLQHDRALSLQAWKLHFAGANLSVCAQTTGGVAGPDSGLMLAIRNWAEADAPFREDIKSRAALPPVDDPKQGDGEGLSAKLRAVISHATGGSLSDHADMPLNDICCWITAFRNKVYEAGQEAALTRPSAAPSEVPAGMVLVSEDEMAELRSRMPWAGGQSPLVSKSAACIAASPVHADQGGEG